MEQFISIPNRFNPSFIDLDYMLKQYNDISEDTGDTVIFDFQNTSFFCGELTAFVYSLARLLWDRKFKIASTKMQAPVKNIFGRNGFLELVNIGKPIPDSYHSSIPLYKGLSSNEEDLTRFLSETVFGNSNWPTHLRQESHEIEVINNAIYEITRNVKEHSGSETVYMCGQFYPNSQQLHFSIVDSGMSIPRNIRNTILKDFNSDADVIDWATQEGNSTKQTPASGLGLLTIKENLDNEGEFTILSHKGFWKQTSKNKIIKHDIKNIMPGTLIHLNFFLNTDRGKDYSSTISNDTMNSIITF